MYSWKMRNGSTRAVARAALLTVSLTGQMVRAEQLDPTNPVNRRNVLTIILDDVGVDQIEPYITYYNTNARTDDNIDVTSASGADMTPLTPTIQKLADAGVMFVNAWACPTCSPTRASIMTGTYPFRHQVYSPTNAESFTVGDTAISGDPTTIAEVLGTAPTGYASGLFGKWHLGENSNHGPVDHGWALHEGYLGGQLVDYYAWEKVTSDASGDTFEDLAGCTEYYAPMMNVDDAVEWINGKDDSDHWMATVAFNAAHSVDSGWAASVPPTGCGRALGATPTDSEVYRATIECVDAQIADLLNRIGTAKLANTTIMVMGDNGTEAQRSEHFSLANFGSVNHAKGTLFEGGPGVPLIIAGGYWYLINNGRQATATGGTGQVLNPGRISTALVQGVDLFATIADIAGADKSCGVDAFSLIPLLEDTGTSVRSASFAQTSLTSWAVRDSSYKLIVESGVADKLYNLSNDRWEKIELVATGGYSLFEKKKVGALKTLKTAFTTVADCYP